MPLFDICLALVFESNQNVGKVIALDEAHKFISSNDVTGNAFMNSILEIVREQRHKGARVIVSTQEPSLSPKLLDLCSMTFVHRCSSPAWLSKLKTHLVAAQALAETLVDGIVNLGAGKSILFAPSAMLATPEGEQMKLGCSAVKFKIRPRITHDGGRSVMVMN